MPDPLTITGTTVGVISLGIQVTLSLVNFYQSYRGQDSDLLRTGERLDGLLEIFQSLGKTLSDRKFQADEGSLVESIERSVKNCDKLIQELQDVCLKCKGTSSKGIIAAVKGAGLRAIYPFKQSTLQKLDEDIAEILANLSSALDVLQLKDNQRIQDDIYVMKALFDLIRTSQVSSNLRDWLNAPDATINHNAACEKKHPGTGMWLVKGPQFKKWLTEENSILWLNGFAESGKSVLCSTAIQYAFRHRKADPGIGIAFFYFAFNDKSKQDELAMLRALLLQLSSQLQDGHTDLAQLHNSYNSGMPPSPVLISYLQRLIQRFHDVYIVLDALDESPLNGPREHVLDTLEIMRNWGLQCLHLFVTSRDESDIRESLDLSPSHQVGMRNNDNDKDISDFISRRLNTDRRLGKFSPYHTKIQESLAARAKGM